MAAISSAAQMISDCVRIWRVQNFDVDFTDVEGLAVLQRPVELRAVPVDVLGVEDGTKDHLHRLICWPMTTFTPVFSLGRARLRDDRRAHGSQGSN